MLPNFSSFVPKLFSVLVFTAFCAWGAEIKVSVIDPDSRPVAGAQVRLLSGSSIVATQSTTASGEAKFEDISHRELRVEVLAAGFAPATKAIAAGEQNLVVKLGVAAPAQRGSARPLCIASGDVPRLCRVPPGLRRVSPPALSRS